MGDKQLPNLYPYQEEGARWLSTKRLALLADDMGLGKTAQAIRAADMVKAKSILVVCPAVARHNWEDEFNKFQKMKRSILVCTKPRHFNEKPKDVTIISYDALITQKDKLTKKYRDLLILDEAHYLKGIRTRRTQAVYGKHGLVRRSRRVWALTGTPAPNHIGEMWAMLYTFGATDLKYEAFIKKYCHWYIPPQCRHERKMQVTGTKEATIPEIKEMIKDVMKRRRKTDIHLELPKIRFSHISVGGWPPEDLEAAREFSEYFFPADRRDALKEKINNEREFVKSVLEKMETDDAIKVVQDSIATLRRYCGLQKIRAVVKLLVKEYREKKWDKIVVFAVHRDVIDGIRRGLAEAKITSTVIHGGTTPAHRKSAVNRFQNDYTPNVFVGQIQAAGTAITLTRAHHLIMVEQSWVPGDNAQAIMRVHRIGQTKDVSVRYVSVRDSVDDRVNEALIKKTAQLTKIFDSERTSVLSQRTSQED